MKYLESFFNESCFIDIYEDINHKIVKVFDRLFNCVGVYKESKDSSNYTLSKKYFEIFERALL